MRKVKAPGMRSHSRSRSSSSRRDLWNGGDGRLALTHWMVSASCSTHGNRAGAGTGGGLGADREDDARRAAAASSEPLLSLRPDMITIVSRPTPRLMSSVNPCEIIKTLS